MTTWEWIFLGGFGTYLAVGIGALIYFAITEPDSFEFYRCERTETVRHIPLSCEVPGGEANRPATQTRTAPAGRSATIRDQVKRSAVVESEAPPIPEGKRQRFLALYDLLYEVMEKAERFGWDGDVTAEECAERAIAAGWVPGGEADR